MPNPYLNHSLCGMTKIIYYPYTGITPGFHQAWLRRVLPAALLRSLHGSIPHQEHFRSGAFLAVFCVPDLLNYSDFVDLVIFVSSISVVSFFVCIYNWEHVQGVLFIELARCYLRLLSDFLPSLICTKQHGAASVKNKLGMYVRQSGVEIRLWDTSEMCCGGLVESQVLTIMAVEHHTMQQCSVESQP